MRLLPVLAALLIATPAAAWDTQQRSGFASASHRVGGYEITISCRRDRGFELALSDPSLSASEFEGVTGLMMWVTLPDGRTDRWSVDVVQEGPVLSGPLYVSDFNLEFFRNGTSFRLDAPLTRKVFMEGDMRGTGAARLAFLEQCGI
ncbi:MAG: hypothetical protein AAGE18_12030 [Pseudomonadota bacterium]